MACKLFTKSFAWKKTATKLLCDANHNVSLSSGNDVSHLTATVLPTLNKTRKYSLSGSYLPHISNQRPSSTRNHGVGDLYRNCKSSLVDNISDLNTNCGLVQSLSMIHTSADVGDQSKGSGNAGSAVFGERTTVEGKVGIISSMFGEQSKTKMDAVEEQKADEKEQKDEKEKGGQQESPFLRSQRIAKWVLLGTFAVSTPLMIIEFGPPKRDEFGDIIPDEFSEYPVVVAYIKRAWSEVKLVEKDIVEPSSQKLLPDVLQEPYYQPPYTLVIELFDVLLHPVYDQVHGWRFKKRPGIDHFLAQVGPPLYEIVIFTRETGMTAFPLIDSMDPKGYIMYRLFRDAARFKSGFQLGNIFKGEFPKLDPYYQKDLKYLNRDLRRVVVVDNDKRATELQPNNGISLKPWDGSTTDTELYDLAAFLRTVATSEVDDVRPVLEHYRKYDDPLAAFKLAQTRMQEEQAKLAKQLQENKTRPLNLNPLSGGLNMVTKYFKSKN